MSNQSFTSSIAVTPVTIANSDVHSSLSKQFNTFVDKAATTLYSSEEPSLDQIRQVIMDTFANVYYSSSKASNLKRPRDDQSDVDQSDSKKASKKSTVSLKGKSAPSSYVIFKGEKTKEFKFIKNGTPYTIEELNAYVKPLWEGLTKEEKEVYNQKRLDAQKQIDAGEYVFYEDKRRQEKKKNTDVDATAPTTNPAIAVATAAVVASTVDPTVAPTGYTITDPSEHFNEAPSDDGEESSKASDDADESSEENEEEYIKPKAPVKPKKGGRTMQRAARR